MDVKSKLKFRKMENLKADTQYMSTYKVKEKYGGIVVPHLSLFVFFNNNASPVNLYLLSSQSPSKKRIFTQ